MPAFAYTAIDNTGQKISGSLSVRNKAEAYRELEAKSLTPVVVKEDATGAAGKAGSKVEIGKPVKLKSPQMILFTEELADLLDAGLQLEQALGVLTERQQDKDLKTVAATLREEIREGANFSGALRKASPSFDDLYRNLVAAGEASGALPEILRRLGGNQKQMFDLQRRTVSAMIYPAVLVLGCVALLFVFSTVLMPQLTKLIKKTGGGELPLISELLIKFSNFMNQWWWLVLAIGVAIFIMFKAFIRTPKGHFWWDNAKMKIPGFGPVIAGRFYAQFCHTMSILVNNGVPLLNGLKLVTRGTTNIFVKKHLEKACADVGEGISLARTMDASGTFPPQLVDRVAIGEKTGELGKAFSKAAVKYDEDLDVRIGRLTSLIPMVVLIAMAVIVGMVAFAIINTIFGSMSGIRGK